jgi:hypothetical protein
MPHEWEALAQDPDVKPLLTREVDGREVTRTYLRHAERTTEAAEIETTERKLTDPVERRFLTNPGKLAQQNAQRRKNLMAQSPPTDLTVVQRDKLARLERETRAFVAENMPTAEQMRHNPPGAVDHHMAWDRHAKPALLVWKNVRLLLNPRSDAVDLANFERYRPANAATRSLFSDGQIPGQWALGPQAKAHYDDIDWSSPEVAAKIQSLLDSGAVTIRTRGAAHPHAAPATATKAPAAVTATCDIGDCGVSYRGGFGPANLRRHQAKDHGVREEVPA